MKILILVTAPIVAVIVLAFPALSHPGPEPHDTPPVSTQIETEIGEGIQVTADPEPVTIEPTNEFEPDAPPAADVIVGPDPEPIIIDEPDEFEPDAPPAADVIVGPIDPQEGVEEETDYETEADAIVESADSEDDIFAEKDSVGPNAEPVEDVIGGRIDPFVDFDEAIPQLENGRTRLINGTIQLQGQASCTHDVVLSFGTEPLTGGTVAVHSRIVDCEDGIAELNFSLTEVELAQGNGAGPHQYIVHLGLSNAENPFAASFASSPIIVRKIRATDFGLDDQGWGELTPLPDV